MGRQWDEVISYTVMGDGAIHSFFRMTDDRRTTYHDQMAEFLLLFFGGII